MAQLFYGFLMYVTGTYELDGLLSMHENTILAIFAAAGLLFCFFGFYWYRGAVSGLTFLCTILIGSLLVRPACGEQAAVTFSAIFGVILPFLAFRWYRFGSVFLCAVLAGSGAYLACVQAALPFPATILLTAVLSALAGVFTFLFPFWGVCGFTALCGAAVFVEEGQHLWEALPHPGTTVAAALCVLCAALGLACQLYVFRHQKLFARIMPPQVEYRIQKFTEERRQHA